MTTIEYLRSFRIAKIALFDLTTAFLGAFILDILFFHSTNKRLYYSLVIPVGILAHMLMGQTTTLNTKLFNNEFNIYKLAILSLLFTIVPNPL